MVHSTRGSGKLINVMAEEDLFISKETSMMVTGLMVKLKVMVFMIFTTVRNTLVIGFLISNKVKEKSNIQMVHCMKETTKME